MATDTDTDTGSTFMPGSRRRTPSHRSRRCPSSRAPRRTRPCTRRRMARSRSLLRRLSSSSSSRISSSTRRCSARTRTRTQTARRGRGRAIAGARHRRTRRTSPRRASASSTPPSPVPTPVVAAATTRTLRQMVIKTRTKTGRTSRMGMEEGAGHRRRDRADMGCTITPTINNTIPTRTAHPRLRRMRSRCSSTHRAGGTGTRARRPSSRPSGRTQLRRARASRRGTRTRRLRRAMRPKGGGTKGSEGRKEIRIKTTTNAGLSVRSHPYHGIILRARPGSNIDIHEVGAGRKGQAARATLAARARFERGRRAESSRVELREAGKWVALWSKGAGYGEGKESRLHVVHLFLETRREERCANFFSFFFFFSPPFCISFSLSLFDSLVLLFSFDFLASARRTKRKYAILILMLAFHHFSTTLLHQLTICDPCPNIYLFSYPFFLSINHTSSSPLESTNTCELCPVIQPYDLPYSVLLLAISLQTHPNDPLSHSSPLKSSLFLTLFPLIVTRLHCIQIVFFFLLQHIFLLSFLRHASVHLCPCLCLCVPPKCNIDITRPA